MSDFIGRDFELTELIKRYNSPKSQIAVIYGRRRVGKSSLVDQLCKKRPYLKFEGLEGEHTTTQISHVTKTLANQINDPLLKNYKFRSWDEVFDYLTQYFAKSKRKIILFLDELQWLAANQTHLVSLLKYYWDNHWKRQSVFLILCGSVSSYMVRRVIRSKALYGRIDFELPLGPFYPHEALKMLRHKRSKDETFLYLLILGGIPKYLEMVNPNHSFSQNMSDLFFKKGSYFSTEYEKIFYSQFREHKNYEKIVRKLNEGPATLNEISELLSIPSGGGLKVYLENLEKSLFITGYKPYDKEGSRLIKYQLTDEYLRFYFKYITPLLNRIATNETHNLFAEFIAPKWHPWLGLQFENFCLKNALFIAKKLGFSSEVLGFGPYFRRGDPGFQIDLLYLRQNRIITLCEIKFHAEEITPSIIPEVEKKCALLAIPAGYTLEKCLISRFGPNKALASSKYFHHEISVADFF